MKNWIRSHPYILPWTALLLLVIGAGLVGAFLVWTRGLVVTGLSDQVPWGLWITLDLSTIGVGAGAFLFSAAIYLFKRKELEPLARVAVLVGVLGYTSASLALLLDLGRPDRFWRPIVSGNLHSVLWEITMCVILYLTVLVIEFAPVVGHSAWLEDKFPWLAQPLQRLHGLAPVLAVAGLALSLLHQSSLGATYAVLPFRPLWGKPGTAVLFLFNAVVAGPALTILATGVAQRVLRRQLVPRALLFKLGRIIGWAAVVYLYMRLWDVFAMSYTHIPGRTEGLAMLTGGSLTAPFWLGEILLGLAIPALLLLVPALRERPGALWVACALAVAGLVITRWDVNIASMMIKVGYIPGQAISQIPVYRPSWVEWATGAAIIGYWLMGFTWSLHLFPVFSAHHQEEPVHGMTPSEVATVLERRPSTGA